MTAVCRQVCVCPLSAGLWCTGMSATTAGWHSSTGKWPLAAEGSTYSPQAWSMEPGAQVLGGFFWKHLSGVGVPGRWLKWHCPSRSLPLLSPPGIRGHSMGHMALLLGGQSTEGGLIMSPHGPWTSTAHKYPLLCLSCPLSVESLNGWPCGCFLSQGMFISGVVLFPCLWEDPA